MKKIICSLVIFIIIFISKDVLASDVNLRIDYQEGIYSNRESSLHIYNGKLGYIYLNNKIAYCLEPFKIIGSNYKEDNLVLNIDPLLLDYYKLASAYGYNEINNNIYYYMATQELIWRKNPALIRVYWTTTSSSASSRIIIDGYKNEISKKIEEARIKPNFNVKEINPDINDIIELTDVNNVLGNYEIINNSKNEIWKEKNKLYIKILDLNNADIKFVKRIKSGVSTNGYKESSTYQALATFAIDEIVEENLSIIPNEYNSKIKITTMSNSKLINDKLTFKIYNLNTSQFVKINENDIFKTDEKGEFISDFKLSEGTYEIFNLDIPNNYVYSDSNTVFQIKEDNELDNNYYEIFNYLDIPYGILNYQEKIKYNNLIVPNDNKNYYIYAADNLYDNNYNLLYLKNQFVKSISTNENGQFTTTLPVGNYYITNDEKEVTNFLINYIDKYTKEIIKNIIVEKNLERSTIKINVQKQIYLNDSCQNQNYDNIEYGLYAASDIYLNDILVYKNNQLIYKLISNEITEVQIPLGSYYIKELTQFDDENKFTNYYFKYEHQNLELNIIKQEKEKIFEDEVNDINVYQNNLKNENNDFNQEIDEYENNFSSRLIKENDDSNLNYIDDNEYSKIIKNENNKLLNEKTTCKNNKCYCHNIIWLLIIIVLLILIIIKDKIKK
ncbi:MAG: SpaA isopeptide-forming pilin-related protein [Bacilli bacterium]|nr:SpaA isopeptide-forming pilin-related protein [Bacilli bacterium]